MIKEKYMEKAIKQYFTDNNIKTGEITYDPDNEKITISYIDVNIPFTILKEFQDYFMVSFTSYTPTLEEMEDCVFNCI